MIELLVASNLVHKTAFGICWYLLILLSFFLAFKHRKLSSLWPLKIWVIAFGPLFFLTIGSSFIHNVRLNYGELLEISLAGSAFCIGLQHMHIARERLMLGLSITAVIGSVIALVEVFYYGSARAGWNSQPISLGIAAGLVSTLLLVNWVDAKRTEPFTSTAIPAILALIALGLSASRGPGVAFAAVLLYSLLLCIRPAVIKQNLYLKSLPVGLFLILYLCIGAYLHLERIYVEIASEQATSSGLRLEMAKASIEKISDVLFWGIGHEQTRGFLAGHETIGPFGFDHVHNTLLNFSLELGIFGGVAYLWSFFFLWIVFRQGRTNGSGYSSDAGIATLLFLFIASFTQDLMDHSFIRKVIAFYLALLLVLMHQETRNSTGNS